MTGEDEDEMGWWLTGLVAGAEVWLALILAERETVVEDGFLAV